MPKAARRPLAVPSSEFDAFDRMLLTADGTITTLLEACTGEPIATRAIRQAGPATLDRLLAAVGWWWQPDAGLLELAPAERVIARRAILRGARGGIPYVLAESLVVPDRLPRRIGDGLMRAGSSIGRLLADRGLETRREVLQITAVRAGTASDHLGVAPSATLARRTYRIVIAQRAAAVVTEWISPGRVAAAAFGPVRSAQVERRGRPVADRSDQQRVAFVAQEGPPRADGRPRRRPAVGEAGPAAEAGLGRER